MKHAFDPTFLTHLEVRQATIPNVWHISRPLRRFARADAQRAALLSKFASVVPHTMLWLSDWAIDDGPTWRSLTRIDALSELEEELNLGGWALFFFASASAAAAAQETAPVPVANDPQEASRVLQQLRAEVAIWSWYDDRDWLIAVAPSEP
jgi:hypothetical protein